MSFCPLGKKCQKPRKRLTESSLVHCTASWALSVSVAYLLYEDGTSSRTRSWLITVGGIR